jgi:glycerol-3-phosphate dehydrogenase
MNRAVSLSRLRDQQQLWDIAIIGGGATGLGIAVDAASRGYSVALLEQSDFGKGTSSRSTKLIHGGVRYLEQGNIGLVTEALRERSILLHNAPHLVHELEFIVPNYAWWEAPFYGVGLKVYDLLAGKHGFGRSRILSRQAVLERIPTLEPEGLRGGVIYRDGQFDDARMLISLAQTAENHGACLINYFQVEALSKNSDGNIIGVVGIDRETDTRIPIAARCVFNATGPFCDSLRSLDEADCTPLLAPSQGVHLVLSSHFLPGNSAIMVPHTRDGRVLFALPWNGHTLVGTTDTPIPKATLDPIPTEAEISFILETAGEYLDSAPTRDDILSVFVGIRPLVKNENAASSAVLSRDHTIQIADSGLITVTGGKWTTYRNMAEDAIDQAIDSGPLEPRACITKTLRLYGWKEGTDPSDPLSVYGTTADALRKLVEEQPELGELLHPASEIIAAQVVWAVREEMARTVEDVLARRTRVLFVNAHLARTMAPAVAALLAVELGKNDSWIQTQLEEFKSIASLYLPPESHS